MRTLTAFVAAAFLSSAVLADDLADTKKAFATLVEYQKTDDERSPELFAKDCVVTFVIMDGAEKQTAIIPTALFFETMKKQIAKKKGNRETYEGVEYSPEASGVLVTANVRYPKSGRTGPFAALYRRDRDGVLRVHDLKITLYGDE